MATADKKSRMYLKGVSKLPPTVEPVATAIPAFIGCTQKITDTNATTIITKPIRINTLREYEDIFGKREEQFEVQLGTSLDGNYTMQEPIIAPKRFYKMYYALQMYFANGGGPCYIVSVGQDNGIVSLDNYIEGLNKIASEEEPTLLIFPDAELLGKQGFYNLYQQALAECAQLKNRFLIADVYEGYKNLETPSKSRNVIHDFRNLIGANHLSYGAAYYPHLETTLSFGYDETKVNISDEGSMDKVVLRNDASPNHSLYHTHNDLYHLIKQSIDALPVVLPPSSTVAGVYVSVDTDRGVWKAPANIGMNSVQKMTVDIDNLSQENLIIDASGKSINALRAFDGKGFLVWGARTLEGNDNEWRYINVRRYINMVETSIRKASEAFTMEPNDANTWVKIRGMIEHFLVLQWRAGALAGAKPEQAFYIRVGLGETMITQDILGGKMIVEVGLSVIRPAEFIVLRISHNMKRA